MSKITGFYTDDKDRVRPITARKTSRRPQVRMFASTRIFGYYAEYKDTEHARLVTCYFRVGTRYVEATNEFELGKDLESQFLGRPLWNVDAKSLAAALKSVRRDELSHFKISENYNPEKIPSRHELKELAKHISIASRFKHKDELPYILYDSADRKVKILLHEPTTLSSVEMVHKLREKRINYRPRHVVLRPLTDFAWQLPDYQR